METCAVQDKVVESWSVGTLGVVLPRPSIRAQFNQGFHEVLCICVGTWATSAT